MSGVETAGIVLAAFPLCIELIKHYSSGTATLKDMRDYHRLLGEFQRELKMESCKFYNSLYNLFEDTITEEDCEWFFNDTEGAKERLKTRLDRPHSLDNFIHAVEAMRTELLELQKELGAVGIVTPGGDIDAKCADTKYCKRLGKRLKKRFKLAILKEEYSDRMRHITKINADIDMLVNGAKQSAANLTGRSTKAEVSAIDRYYKRVRNSAQSICDALTKRIQAPHDCGSSQHGISLCLEMRSAVSKPKRVSRYAESQSISDPTTVSFRILFSLAEAPTAVPTWRELEVETVEASGDKEDCEPMQGVDPGKRVPAFCVTPSISGSPNERPPQAARRQVLFSNAHSVPLPKDHGQRPVTPTGSRSMTEFVTKVSSIMKGGNSGFFGGKSSQSSAAAVGILPEQSSPPTPTPSDLHDDVVLGIVRRLTGDTYTKDGARVLGTGAADQRLIHDICQTIKQSKPIRQCLGLLDREDSSQSHSYRVWSMPVGGCFDLANTAQNSMWVSGPVSLLDLLQSATLSSGLTIRDRLSIGIKLASSVIQLHHTQWLSGSWSKEDIIFFADPVSRAPLIDKPLVLRDLSSPHAEPKQLGATSKKNKILFSLGLVLYELWFWKRLEDFCHDERGRSQQPVAIADYTQWTDIILLEAADRALKELDINAPRKYSDAVRTCLFGNISPGAQDFIPTVWERVVCPLQENFQAFNDPSRRV